MGPRETQCNTCGKAFRQGEMSHQAYYFQHIVIDVGVRDRRRTDLLSICTHCYESNNWIHKAISKCRDDIWVFPPPPKLLLPKDEGTCVVCNECIESDFDYFEIYSEQRAWTQDPLCQGTTIEAHLKSTGSTRIASVCYSCGGAGNPFMEALSNRLQTLMDWQWGENPW